MGWDCRRWWLPPLPGSVCPLRSGSRAHLEGNVVAEAIPARRRVPWNKTAAGVVQGQNQPPQTWECHTRLRGKSPICLRHKSCQGQRQKRLQHRRLAKAILSVGREAPTSHSVSFAQSGVCGIHARIDTDQSRFGHNVMDEQGKLDWVREWNNWFR